MRSVLTITTKTGRTWVIIPTDNLPLGRCAARLYLRLSPRSYDRESLLSSTHKPIHPAMLNATHRTALRTFGPYILAALLLAPFFTSCSSGPVTSAPPSSDSTVRIGGLFSLTGDWSTLGNAGSAALQLAISDVNDYLAVRGNGIRFESFVEDTRLDPETAYADLAELVQDHGIQVVIGPQSSAELMRLKAYSDSTGVIIISPSSTAGSLSISGDHIYRFCPDDSREGAASTALMQADGIKGVVPIWKNDAGNGGLQAAVRSSFGNSGGLVMPGVSYQDASNAAAIVAAASAQAKQAGSLYGDSAVAIYLASFDEGVAILAAAKNDPTLAGIRWYAGDGIAQSAKLAADPIGGEFATHAGFVAPLLGLDPASADQRANLVKRIHAVIGYDPDVFSLAVYDAVWVAARTLIARNGVLDPRTFDAEFKDQAGSYFGATGWTVLNEAGDRKYGDFDFWSLTGQGGAYTWQATAHYQSESGRLTR